MEVKYSNGCYLRKVTYFYHMYRESLWTWHLVPIVKFVYNLLERIYQYFWDFSIFLGRESACAIWSFPWITQPWQLKLHMLFLSPKCSINLGNIFIHSTECNQQSLLLAQAARFRGSLCICYASRSLFAGNTQIFCPPFLYFLHHFWIDLAEIWTGGSSG